MTLELKISVLSAIAALGSAYWAWNSARTARKALALTEEDAITKREALKGDLINSLRWQRNDCEYISLSCSYMNSSSYPTTIERVELVVHGFALEGTGSQLRQSPEYEKPDRSDFSFLVLPINLSARATSSGWLTFRLPKPWLNRYLIDKYELVATTWSGQKVTIESYIVMKQAHE
ncbi:hypothetical protein CBX96_19940 [Shewanella sp. BC20]|uniref:hypothetical protein n=1 Tax=Shewanella sp. BC20 TaxID=2004459 RepID=UPI000D66B255|nr:hypothetical protein [Shewanella sp. BC20]PWF61611.1 hypothetical protein CBX96_19940 [Shewanella sp. BC20]